MSRVCLQRDPDAIRVGILGQVAVIFVTPDKVATMIAAGPKAIFIGIVKWLHPGGVIS
jgi:hypothetical protein